MAAESPKKMISSDTSKKSAVPENKSVKDKGGMDGPGANNSGWFGGIWNKITLKPKNQMILPDDKNPSVSVFKSKNDFK